MRDKLTEEQVRGVGRLSRLKCSEQEIAEFTAQLGAILDYVALLDELDTKGVEPLAHCLPVHNVFREDEVEASLSNEQALANAPQREDGFFAVPRILGQAGT